LIDRRIEIVTDIEPGTWVCTADTGQIQQVIMNLVVNARDAIRDCIEEGHEGVITKDYRIILSLKGTTIGQDDVSRHPDARQGDFVVISVTDNGKGIDQDTLRHIFEPFFTTKLYNQGKRKRHRTGSFHSYRHCQATRRLDRGGERCWVRHQFFYLSSAG